MPSNITYYNDFRNISAISNPILDNDCFFSTKGGFISSYVQEAVKFNATGFGIKKRNGIIYCENSSNLFSFQRGYVGITLSMPNDINNGIINGINDFTGDIGKYLIWGVNIGENYPIYPTINLQFTQSGISLNFKNSRGEVSLIDDVTDNEADEPIFIECIWDADGIDDFSEDTKITIAYKVNGTYLMGSNFPLSNQSDMGNFCILNTPFLKNNYEVTLLKIIIADGPLESINEELHSSSSSSSSESSSS